MSSIEGTSAEAGGDGDRQDARARRSKMFIAAKRGRALDNPFYVALDRLLRRSGFGEFAEETCRDFYAGLLRFPHADMHPGLTPPIGASVVLRRPPQVVPIEIFERARVGAGHRDGPPAPPGGPIASLQRTPEVFREGLLGLGRGRGEGKRPKGCWRSG